MCLPPLSIKIFRAFLSISCISIIGHCCVHTRQPSLRKHPFLHALRRWGRFARGTSATQRQKFHTDDANRCLLNKSGSQEVPNVNSFNFRFLLVDFGLVLLSSANELQQNSNACSREDYIPQILTVLLEIHRIYI